MVKSPRTAVFNLRENLTRGLECAVPCNTGEYALGARGELGLSLIHI